MKFKVEFEFEEETPEIALEKIDWMLKKESVHPTSKVKIAYVMPQQEPIAINFTIDTNER